MNPLPPAANNPFYSSANKNKKHPGDWGSSKAYNQSPSKRAKRELIFSGMGSIPSSRSSQKKYSPIYESSSENRTATKAHEASKKAFDFDPFYSLTVPENTCVSNNEFWSEAARGQWESMGTLWRAAASSQWVFFLNMLGKLVPYINSAPFLGPDAGKTPLWLAAKKQQWDVVLEILKVPGCNVNGAPYNGTEAVTPLWMAAKAKRWDVVGEMLRLPGCDVNASPPMGEDMGITPLWLAAQAGQWPLVLKMMSMPGADINASPLKGPHAGKTPFWFALANHQTAIAAAMLRRHSCNVNTSPATGPDAGKTPLWWASYWNETGLIQAMLRTCNCQVNARPFLNENALTPFWFAVQRKQWDIVREMLLHPGSDINEWHGDFGSPLWAAAFDGQWNLVDEMLRIPHCNVNQSPKGEGTHAGKTALWLAAQAEQWDIVRKMLLLPGCNPHAAALHDPEHKGKTPLWFAIYHDEFAVAAEMAKLPGLDLYAAPEGGDVNTTLLGLLLQEEEGRRVLTGILHSPGFDINSGPSYGPFAGQKPLWTAAHYAEEDNSKIWETVREMLKLPGCDINVSPFADDDFTRTPLWFAVKDNRLDIAGEMLIAAGIRAVVNMNPGGDVGGESPLYYLIHPVELDTSMTSWFLLLGADVDESKLLECSEKLLEDIKAVREKKKHLIETMCNLVTALFDGYAENGLRDVLPNELKLDILLENLYQTHPELRAIPRKILLELAADIEGRIAQANRQKAIGWYIKRAYAWYKGENQTAGTVHLTFAQFEAIWQIGFDRCPGFVVNHPFRESLLDHFKKIKHHPTPDSCESMIASLLHN